MDMLTGATDSCCASHAWAPAGEWLTTCQYRRIGEGETWGAAPSECGEEARGASRACNVLHVYAEGFARL